MSKATRTIGVGVIKATLINAICRQYNIAASGNGNSKNNDKELFYICRSRCFEEKHIGDNAKFVIAVKSDKPSGTKRTIEYAKKSGRQLVIIDPEEYFL